MLYFLRLDGLAVVLWDTTIDLVEWGHFNPDEWIAVAVLPSFILTSTASMSDHFNC